MARAVVVIVGPRDVLPALAARLGDPEGEVVAYSDTEIPQALDVITRNATCAVIERTFAATTRGIAFVNRLRTDPALASLEVRVMAHNSDYARALPREAAPPEAPPPPTPDWHGVRRMPRIALASGAELLVDGTPARLIDLSGIGAQVVSNQVLKPGQRVRVTLVDERVTLRVRAAVVWAAFELTKEQPTPHYRCGLTFEGAEPDAITTYAIRHQRPA